MKADHALDLAEDYLERERRVLLSGQIQELGRLADMQMGVADALAHVEGDPVRVRRLRALADRNSRLLSASAEGVKRAIARLKDLKQASGPIGSYSASGGRCEIGTTRPQFERKA